MKEQIKHMATYLVEIQKL